MIIEKILNMFNKDIKETVETPVESKLSRIWKHIESKGNFSIIAAQRGGLSQKENKMNHMSLIKDVRGMGYGYIEMKGGWEETEEKDGKKIKMMVTEDSLFIPKMDKREALKLGKKYDQETVIVKDDNALYELSCQENTYGKQIRKFKAESGKKNLNLSKELIKKFFSRLKKGSHRDKPFNFTLDEKTDYSNAILAFRQDLTPNWVRIMSEKVLLKDILQEEKVQIDERIGIIAAYWISPSGKRTDLGAKRHIRGIIKDPKKYGFQRSAIKQIYKKHKEKIGLGGKARKEILTSLIKKGWIRVRKHRRHWTIEVRRLSKKIENHIWDFVNEMLKNGNMTLQEKVYISTLRKGFFSTPQEIRSFSAFENVKKNKPVIEESGLSRVWEHNNKHDCGSLTAFRDARNCGKGKRYTRKENKKRNKVLLAKLLSQGYGVTKLKGKYPEGGREGKEESFFVVDLNDTGKLKSNLIKLGEKFEQDSILFIPKGAINNEAQSYLIGTNHCDNNFLGYGKKEKFDAAKLGKKGKIYTSYVNGRPFYFEGLDKSINEMIVPPRSGMGIWAMYRFIEKNDKDII